MPNINDHSKDDDGSSPENAVVVASVGEEYKWIENKYPDYKLVNQALVINNSGCYDLLTIENSKRYQKKFYFNISGFLKLD